MKSKIAVGKVAKKLNVSRQLLNSYMRENQINREKEGRFSFLFENQIDIFTKKYQSKKE